MLEWAVAYPNGSAGGHPHADQSDQLGATAGFGNSREMHDTEVASVCCMLREAIALREKYMQPTDRDVFGDLHEVEPCEDPFAPPIDPFKAPVWEGTPRRLEPSMPPRETYARPHPEPGSLPAAAGKPFCFEMRRGVPIVWQV